MKTEAETAHKDLHKFAWAEIPLNSLLKLHQISRKIIWNVTLISLEFSTYFPQQFSLTNQLLAERILKFLLCPLHFKLQDKLNNLGATHSRTVSSLSFYPLIPFLFDTSSTQTSNSWQIVALVAVATPNPVPAPVALGSNSCLMRRRATCHTHAHIDRRRLRCAPKLYARCTYPLCQIVCLSGCQSPACLLLCSLSQSILNSVPLPFPLPLYRLSAVDCGRFIFTQNGDALQKHTHTSTHTVTHRLHKYFIARVRRARHLNFVIFTKLLKMPPLRKNQSRNPPKKINP